jgi:hypothetical protein
MRIIWLLGLIMGILTVNVSCSCDLTARPNSTVATYELSDPQLDALHFSSEEDMIQQIRIGGKTDPQHNLETIEYYFRPEVLLYEARLYDIRVKAYYVAFDYIIGSEEPNYYENLITFVWYRTRFSTDSEYSAKSLSSSSHMAGSSNGNYSLLGADQKNSICQQVNWDQDGYRFQINAPLWFSPDDLRDMMIAEKVQVSSAVQ